MDLNDVPDLYSILTESEDSVDTLALAKTYTSLDNDEVHLNELVDLISTTIGGKAPILPLREERLSLGVECVLNAKGVAWNLAKQNRNKMSSSEKTAELIELALSKIRELDCSAEANKISHIQKQKSKRKPLSGMTYPEYLDHFAKCKAKKKVGLTEECNELHTDTDINEVTVMNLNSELSLNEVFLPPERTHELENKELENVVTSGNLAEESSEHESKSESGSNGANQMLSLEDGQVEQTNVIAADNMISDGLAEESSELETKSESGSIGARQLLSSDPSALANEIHAERVTTVDDMTSGLKMKSKNDLTNEIDVLSTTFVLSKSDDLKQNHNDTFKNDGENCHGNSIVNSLKEESVDKKKSRSTLKAELVCCSEPKHRDMSLCPESRLDEYDHSLSNCLPPDNHTSPFKGIKNSIPLSPNLTGQTLKNMKSSIASERGRSEIGKYKTRVTTVRKIANSEDKQRMRSLVNKKTKRNGTRPVNRIRDPIDIEVNVSQTAKRKETQLRSKDVVEKIVHSDDNIRKEIICHGRLVTQTTSAASQPLDSRDEILITLKPHEKRTKDQSHRSSYQINNKQFTNPLVNEIAQKSKFHVPKHIDETVSSMTSNTSDRHSDFKEVLEERLLRGREKRGNSNHVHRRPPLSSTDVDTRSTGMQEKNMLIENRRNNSSREIQKSLSMHSSTSNQSSNTVLSTQEIQQSIQYTYSALCRIHASLDEAEVMSVDSDEDNHDYDALFFAKESKNEIAALAKAIELQIAQERCGRQLGCESAHIMTSASYDTAISRDTTISRASINQLIDDVNSLCNQIENKVDNIVRDTIR